MYKKNSNGWLKHLDFIMIDIICLHLSFILSYGIRQGIWNPYENMEYLSIIVALTAISLLVAILFGTFKNALRRGYYRELVATVEHVALVELILSFYMFTIKRGGYYSRMIIFTSAFLYLVLSYITRCLWKKYLQKRMKTVERRNLLIVTTQDKLESAIKNIQGKNLEVFTLMAAVMDKSMIGTVVNDVEVVADVDTVIDYTCREWVDEVFIALPQEDDLQEKLVSDFQLMGLVVHVLIVQNNISSEKQFVEKIGNYTVLTSSLNYVTPRQMFIKRAMDIAGGLVGTFATGLICLVFGPIIYIKSPGPILFTQIRVGRNGKKFKIYKLRTMYMDAEERKKELMSQSRVKDGMMFKLDFDPRIIGNVTLPDGTTKTGIGQFLRKTSLDEFPQFINILKGEMSMVGTRPPTMDEWEKYELHHRARLSTKPGLTGMWQVSGRSNIVDFEEVVKLDTKYINEWSIGLDIKILFKTMQAVFKNEGAM